MILVHEIRMSGSSGLYEQEQMASSIDDLRKAIIEDGFWTVEDDKIGKTLDDLVDSGFHIQTLEGMDLCNVAVFGNKVSRLT